MNTFTAIASDGTAWLGFGLAVALFSVSAMTGFGLAVLFGVAEMVLGVLPVLTQSN